MLTATAPGSTDARSFLLRSVGWSLGLFVVLRLPWTEAHLLLPFVRVQAEVAAGLFGAPSLPVEVTLACSGADALALCLAAVAAYPAGWRARASGFAGGLALILGLNTIRIGSLGQATAAPPWFDLLHLYVWPSILTVAIAGYVFTWMHFAHRRAPQSSDVTLRARTDRGHSRPHRRFILLTLALLLLFSLSAPLYLGSAGVLALATFIAGAAATALNLLGLAAHASDNVLWLPRGGFLVTQECITTPLIPIYLAAVAAFAGTWRRQIIGVLATLPLFVALGVVRLLLVALPDVLGSPTFLVHAFYQLLLAAVVVFLAALWRYDRRSAGRRTLIALTAGTIFVVLVGPLYAHGVSYVTPTLGDDPQGAIAFLPAFQIGLYLALWIAALTGVNRRWSMAGLACLAASQVAGLLALDTVVSHTGSTMAVRDIRAWAILGPVVMAAMVIRYARPSD